MAVFLVFLFGLAGVQAIELGDPTGLHFDVNGEYATSFDNYKPRDYKFEYGVSDPHTGDHKSHWEVRENGVVRGEYSLLEPDGTTRVVQYTADDHNGFRAVVKKIGHATHSLTGQYSVNSHSSPIVIQDTQQNHISEPYFKSYDGAAENYAKVVDNSDLALLLSGGINGHDDLPVLSISQSNILPVEHRSNIRISPYHIGIASSEGITESAPILTDYLISIQNTEPNHIAASLKINDELYSQGPLNFDENIHVQKPVYLEPFKVSSSEEEPTSIGIKIEHPQGESSSSFIGTTGNLADDSEYTGYASGIKSVGWEALPGSAYESPIPHQYWSKRSVKKGGKDSD